MTAGNLTNSTPTETQNGLQAIQNPPTGQLYEQRTKIQNYLVGLLIVVVGLLLFALTRFGNFQTEDFTLLRQLRGTKQTIGDTLGFFLSDWGLDGRFYAPLPRLLFYFEYKFFQVNAAGWHLVSALLHTGAALLVWQLTWRILRRPAVAGLAGLIFAILPGHVAVVAQPVGQAELLATIFCLASAIFFVTARQTEHTSTTERTSSVLRRLGGPYVLSVVFYALALLCKQEALALPLALLGYDFITGGFDRILHQESEVEEENDRSSGHLLGYYMPFLVLVALYLLLSLAFLGGLSAFTSTAQDTTALTTGRSLLIQNTQTDQTTGLGNFLRGNLHYLTQPFGLGGTDGLILLAAIAAFLALTGIQEWEAWQLANPTAVRVRPVAAKKMTATEDDDDDEMDLPPNPLDTLQNPQLPGQTEPTVFTQLEQRHESAIQTFQPDENPPETQITTVEPAEEVPGPSEVVEPPSIGGETVQSEPAIVVEPEIVTPVALPTYWTLRVIGYGFLWTAAFLLPFILSGPGYRILYPASVGFAIFLATVLTPYGLNIEWPNGEKTQARSLFGPFELSFWLRMIAIVTMLAVYFATSVNNIDEWNRASKVFTAMVKTYLVV